MRPVASLFTKFSENFFFGKHQYSFQTGSRSCQVSNGIKGSIATDYAGLGLDCTGVPDIPFPFFTQSAEEPKKESALSTCAGGNYDKSETERESLLPCFRFHPRFDPSNEK